MPSRISMATNVAKLVSIVCLFIPLIACQQPASLLTPDQWAQAYTNSCATDLASIPGYNLEESISLPREAPAQLSGLRWLWFTIMSTCNKASTAWRLLYIDELRGDHYEPMVRDGSLDESYANMIYSTTVTWSADMNYFKFNSGDPSEDLRNELLVAGPAVSAEQCALDLAEMSRQLDEMRALLERKRHEPTGGGNGESLERRHLRLARALDSFGRYESGSLTGHNRLAGSYNQCIRSALERQSGGGGGGELIRMRYCWAKINVDEHLDEQLKQRLRHPLETADPELAVATCLPRSCHTKTLHEHSQTIQRLIDSQLVFPPTIFVNQSLELNSVFCLVDETSEFGMPLSGKLFLVFSTCWLILCLVATIRGCGEVSGCYKPQNWIYVGQEMMAGAINAPLSVPPSSCAERVLRHFNLRKSWRELTTNERRASSTTTTRVELDVLNPLKAFICFFVVMAHTAILFAAISGHQLEAAAESERNTIYIAAFMSSVVIDTLFAMSGLLLTYITLRRLARRKENTTLGKKSTKQVATQFFASWLMISANRYLRLVPLYAIMFWFRRDVLTYLGSGPMWDFGLNRETMNGGCLREPWHSPFTMLAAFRPLNRQCFLPMWSVANDIMFGLLIPPFLLLLSKRPQLTLKLMATLVGLFLIAAFNGYLGSLPDDRWELGQFRIYGFVLFIGAFSDLYSLPHYRWATYFIGCMAGYVLFVYERRENSASCEKRTTSWPSLPLRVATYLASAHLLVRNVSSFHILAISDFISPYNQLAAALLMDIDRPLWAACSAVLFIRMMTDWRHKPLMRAWAGQKWRSLARLNYAMLFTHWLLAVVMYGTILSQPIMTLWSIWATFSGIYLFSLMGALFVHLVFENPIDSLVKNEIFAGLC